jgi:hypothetical protein
LYRGTVNTRTGCIIPTFAADVASERQESGGTSAIYTSNLKLTAEGVAFESRERKRK